MIKNNKLNDAFLDKKAMGLFAFSIILLNYSVYSVSIGKVKIILIVLILLLSVYLSTKSFQIIMRADKLHSLLLFIISFTMISVVIFFSSVIKGQLSYKNILYMWLFPMLISPTILAMKITKNISFFKKFDDIVWLLSIISLFFWLLSLINFPTNSGIVISWGAVRSVPGYFYVHFITQGSVSYFGHSMIRNTGIFAEAPMFSFIVSLALIFHTIIEESKLTDIKNVVYISTICSTFSSTGFIIVALLLAIEIIEKHFQGYKRPLVLLILFITGLIINWIVQLKQKNMYGSYSIRMNDLYSGYLAFLDHPILGNGLNNSNAAINYMMAERIWGSQKNTGFSLGIIDMLSKGGIYYTFFWAIFPMFMFTIRYKNNKEKYLPFLIFVLLTLTIINQTFAYSFLMIYFWIFGVLGN